MTDWQDISTAPTYEPIIMFKPSYGAFLGERRMSGFKDWQDDTYVAQPTHWMPLPPPPNQEGESA